MMLIRRYEEHLYHLFLQGLVPGTLHQCQGQEAVAVGVCSALRRDDVIFSTHRPVGHLIAKGASLDAITAEIWGKATGCVGGKGGQMHLADFSVGAMVSNAIVGANIPIATGSAMAFRLRGLDRVAVSFFGDGASNIGAFHEGINLAAVQERAGHLRLREQPLRGLDAHLARPCESRDIADRAAAYGMPGVIVDGMDVEAVYRRRGDGGRRARAAATGRRCSSARPIAIAATRAAIRAATATQEEHARMDGAAIRSSAPRPADRAISALPPSGSTTIERQCQAEVEAAVAFALASPEPQPSDRPRARLCRLRSRR